VILLLAILAGLVAGLGRAGWQGRSLNLPSLRFLWLVPLAYLPQHLAFQLPWIRPEVTHDLAAAALVVSQLGLLAFTWLNRRHPGFWLLGLGLALNLLVISLNGGLMPISPETVLRLAPQAPPGSWLIGERLGSTKDIVLPMSEMQLWWLSDRFLLLGWYSYHVAFSFGDILIASGAFWFFCSLGGLGEQRERQSALNFDKRLGRSKEWR
jgi:hypothetical protein